MTNEQINIAIAEACGWKLHPQDRWIVIPPNSPHSVQPLSTIPNYCNDLNAMHEAEKTLNSLQAAEYSRIVTSIAWQSEQPSYAPITATARQRAEAFLETIGKWEGV
jgi:hypothetical protein